MSETITKMNPEIKADWLKALRSDDYMQGRNKLRNSSIEGDFHCCLGVLTDLACKAGVLSWDDASDVPEEYRAVSGDVSLPLSVREWSGVDASEPFVSEGRLSTINDNGASFNTIADLIERDL